MIHKGSSENIGNFSEKKKFTSCLRGFFLRLMDVISLLSEKYVVKGVKATLIGSLVKHASGRAVSDVGFASLVAV